MKSIDQAVAVQTVIEDGVRAFAKRRGAQDCQEKIQQPEPADVALVAEHQGQSSGEDVALFWLVKECLHVVPYTAHQARSWLANWVRKSQ